MKQKLIFSIVLLVFATLSVAAMPGERLVINAGNTEHVTISGNLDIILVPGYEQSVLVNTAVSEKINLKFANNTLSIAPANFSRGEKITVYVYVSKLKSLLIENDAAVRTVGVINSPYLDLMVGGEARVHLKTNGVVKPRSVHGAELKVDFISVNGPAREALTRNGKKF